MTMIGQTQNTASLGHITIITRLPIKQVLLDWPGEKDVIIGGLFQNSFCLKILFDHPLGNIQIKLELWWLFVSV